MSIGEGNIGNVGSGNVGVGSTVPPDVARYQELVKAQSSGNVGVGSTAPAGTTETEPDTAVDGGQSDPAPAPGNVGDGNVGDGNVGDGNVGIGTSA